MLSIMGSHLLPFALCQLTGLAMFAAGWWCASRGRRWALATSAAALALLLAKAVLSCEPVWEAALFPWLGYAFLQGCLLSIIGLLFFGLAMAQLPLRWNKAVVGAVAAAVFIAGGCDSWWMVAPEAHGESAGAGADHHCEQTTNYTCAPSACVSALSYVAVQASEREMAALCLTHDVGTTVFNTYRGLSLRLAGTAYRARIVNRSVEELAQAGVTAVVTEQPGYHAIAIHGEGGSVTAQDPKVRHPLTWSSAQFREHYYGTVAVVIEPLP
jgi:hypothetical protein